MALGERMLHGKYSMFKDQVRLSVLFCHNLLGDLYCLYATFKHVHFESTTGRGIMESSLPPLV